VLGVIVLKAMLPPSTGNQVASPTIIGFKPVQGGAGTVVRIRGKNLGDAVDILFNGQPAQDITVVSQNAVDVVVPKGATTGSITVRHGTTFRSADTFTVEATPTITGTSADSAGVRMHITITGTNLTSAKAISFNGQPARNFSVTSDTAIDVAVPVGAGTGRISVTTVGGTALSPKAFTVEATPVITQFTPLEGGVGTTVTITGANFTGATGVVFDNSPAVNFSVTSSSTIVAVVPSGATSGRITVVGPGGTGSRSRFRIVSPPAISALNVNAATVGTVITITGTYLLHAKSVTFNGVPAVVFSTPNSHIVKVTVPVGATSGPVTVTTSGGTATSPESFTVSPG
jgi:hypothetical protein